MTSLARVQSLRKLALAGMATLGLLLALFISSAWPPEGAIDEGIEIVGVCLILVCILGRTWCSLYISDRKIRELVTVGPYSITRNPLYVFSVVGAAGCGAMFGSLLFAFAAGGLVALVFSIVVRREEATLLTVHGAAYQAYCRRVPRFLPRLSAWSDVDHVPTSPAAVRVTFLDSLFFLCAIPMAIGIEGLQQAGYLPSLLLVP